MTAAPAVALVGILAVRFLRCRRNHWRRNELSRSAGREMRGDRTVASRRSPTAAGQTGLGAVARTGQVLVEIGGVGGGLWRAGGRRSPAQVLCGGRATGGGGRGRVTVRHLLVQPLLVLVVMLGVVARALVECWRTLGLGNPNPQYTITIYCCVDLAEWLENYIC